MIAEAIDYKEKYEALFMDHVQLRDELDQHKRLVFGSRHERFVPAIPAEQFTLGLSVPSVEPVAAAAESITYTRIRKNETAEKVSTGRMKLPADLPREKIIIEPIEDVRGMRKIGEEITEELERIPGKLFVKQYRRPKKIY